MTEKVEASAVWLFVSGDTLLRQAAALLWSLHEGIWLGFLSRRMLHRVAEYQYTAWNRYRDESYNQSGFVRWEQDVLERFFTDIDSVLVAAAGGGREVLALRRTGYAADGFDCVRVLVEAGIELLERQGIPARLAVARPDEVPDGFAGYDGVIVGWGGYMHIQGRERRIEFLHELHSRMKRGGPLLLSFFTRPVTGRRYVLVRAIANGIRAVRFATERLETGDRLDRTLDHHFTETEIRAEMEAAGFEMVFYSEEGYGHAVGKAL